MLLQTDEPVADLRGEPDPCDSVSDPAWQVVEKELTKRLWVFRSKTGALIKNVLSFLPNGQIANHDDPRQRTWSLGSSVFRLHREDGSVQAIFDRCACAGGRILMSGATMSGSDSEAVFLEGRRTYERPTHPARSTLHVEISLARPERPLIAMFNGGGTPYTERGPNFDFYRLPLTLDVDYIRFAEHEHHFAGYFDKTRVIERHLEFCLTHGHRRVVLFGFSAAGYACIVVAELLAARFPDLSFVTVLVNVQTVLDPASNDELVARVPGRFLPPIWGDWTPEVADFHYRPIPKMIEHCGGLRRNVHHIVLYDVGNPAERHHSEPLDQLPGFELRPVFLEMAHADGITEMFRRGDIEAALRDATDRA